ncbi:hypothetical protein CPC08DRAFT_717559 [Agrocybe pediades]|nr:hypothetical protein CPC08DRAFT_717559 [Agrocybe pediades]
MAYDAYSKSEDRRVCRRHDVGCAFDTQKQNTFQPRACAQNSKKGPNTMADMPIELTVESIMLRCTVGGVHANRSTGRWSRLDHSQANGTEIGQDSIARVCGD